MLPLSSPFPLSNELVGLRPMKKIGFFQVSEHLRLSSPYDSSGWHSYGLWLGSRVPVLRISDCPVPHKDLFATGSVHRIFPLDCDSGSGRRNSSRLFPGRNFTWISNSVALHSDRHGDYRSIRSSHRYRSALLRFYSRLYQPSCVGGIRNIFRYRPIHPKGLPDRHSRLSSGPSLRRRRVPAFSPETAEAGISDRIFGRLHHSFCSRS